MANHGDDLATFMCDFLKCGSYCSKNELECVEEWQTICGPTLQTLGPECDVDCNVAPPRAGFLDLGVVVVAAVGVSAYYYLHLDY